MSSKHDRNHVDHLPHRKLPQHLKLPPVPEAKHPHHVPKEPNYGHHLNDHETRTYRKASTLARLETDRAKFESRLQILRDGYHSDKTLDAYDIDRTLGEGSFGRVVLARLQEQYCSLQDERKFVAIKLLKKQAIVDEKQVEHTTNEKNLLFCMSSPFIVSFVDYMLDRHNVYFVLEFVPAEMFTVLQKQPGHRFPPDTVRFFAAQTVLAFEYLQNLEIVFRDLKPENMVITARGNAKIIDFGFAKRIKDKTWTMCGTPEYIAPEILANRGYGFSADWWAIGVLCYEMRAGRSPFESFSQLDMFRKIRGGKYTFPRDFTIKEKLFIGGLLQTDVTRRLGVMHGGAMLVKKQPYFDGVAWEALHQGSVPSPFRLSVGHSGDASNFEVDEEDKHRDLLAWEGDPIDGEYDGAFDHF